MASTSTCPDGEAPPDPIREAPDWTARIRGLKMDLAFSSRELERVDEFERLLECFKLKLDPSDDGTTHWLEALRSAVHTASIKNVHHSGDRGTVLRTFTPYLSSLNVTTQLPEGADDEATSPEQRGMDVDLSKDIDSPTKLMNGFQPFLSEDGEDGETATGRSRDDSGESATSFEAHKDDKPSGSTLLTWRKVLGQNHCDVIEDLQVTHRKTLFDRLDQIQTMLEHTDPMPIDSIVEGSIMVVLWEQNSAFPRNAYVPFNRYFAFYDLANPVKEGAGLVYPILSVFTKKWRNSRRTLIPRSQECPKNYLGKHNTAMRSVTATQDAKKDAKLTRLAALKQEMFDHSVRIFVAKKMNTDLQKEITAHLHLEDEASNVDPPDMRITPNRWGRKKKGPSTCANDEGAGL